MTPAPRTARRLLAALTVPLIAMVAGCGADRVSPGATASVTGLSDLPAAPAPKVRRIVLLDPGHNGDNPAHLSEINKKVPDGRGGTKPCNTTGTATDDGYPEHKFNWDVALRVAELLVANNVNVKLTRTSDTGVGPCVDVRGEMPQKIDADLMVSIHADGAAPSGKGFHVAYPRPALNTAQGAPSLALATALRDALRGAGLPESNYQGKEGLAPRSDLAGLNLSKRPVALVECANMRNPDEAETVSNSVGRARYAQAIAIGILNWLSHLPPGQGARSTATAAGKHSGSTSASESAGSAARPGTTGSDGGDGSSASSDSVPRHTTGSTAGSTRAGSKEGG